ncbi:MAG: ATP-binding protein [bacterium]|nr:ATP-binding protein [bacterium]
MANRNPFSPTFGAAPPELAGRDEVFEAIEEALETGPTHPDYSALLIGARGTGKTVALEAAEERARSRGWLTISETAFPPELPERIAKHAVDLLHAMGDEKARWRVTGVHAASMGVTVEHHDADTSPLALRSALTALGELLKARGTGLLITIDELQAGDIGEVREIGSILQHVTRREGQPAAFLGAALPSIEDSLLAGDSATFLQRCSIHEIGRLAQAATRAAIAKPIQNQGARITAEALEAAVAATSGYPFMVQLVGFYSWRAAGNPEAGITPAEVSEGINEAERRISRLVLWPTWKDLSDVDRKFLIAMASDRSESKISDVASRLGVTVSYAGVYRRRLLRSGMITATGKGRIAFAHPATCNWILSLADPDGDQG